MAEVVLAAGNSRTPTKGVIVVMTKIRFSDSHNMRV